MDPLSKPKTSLRTTKNGANPFAQALAETERERHGPLLPLHSPNNNPFTEALARTNKSNLFGLEEDTNQFDWTTQQDHLLQQQEKLVRRRELHNKIQPVEQFEVFAAIEKQTQRELEQVRLDIKATMAELNGMRQDLEIQVDQKIVENVKTGTYYRNYLHQLRQWITLLRQKVRSARVWAQQMQIKQNKRAGRKNTAVLDFQANETKAVHDMSHHERSSTFSGG